MDAKNLLKKWVWLAAIPVLAAMGSSTPPPGPVQLPRVEIAPQAPSGQSDMASTPATSLSVFDAAEVEPTQFLGTARPLLIFADSASDSSFRSELAALIASPAALIERDVVVITDVDPAANSVWRQRLRPDGFSLVLIDKDGQVKQRKPVLWDVREISRAIDKFPSRRVETGRAGYSQ